MQYSFFKMTAGWSHCSEWLTLRATVGPWGPWIPIGMVKMLHRNSLRLSSLIHSIKPSEETLAPSGWPNQSSSTRRCGGWRLQAERAAAWARATSSTALSVALLVRLEKAQYSPAPPLPLIYVIFVKFLSNKQFRTLKKKDAWSLEEKLWPT